MNEIHINKFQIFFIIITIKSLLHTIFQPHFENSFFLHLVFEPMPTSQHNLFMYISAQ